MATHECVPRYEPQNFPDRISGYFWFGILFATASVFGIIAGLGEVGIGVFQDWVLIAVAELISECGVAVVIVFFAFDGALGAIGIIA